MKTNWLRHFVPNLGTVLTVAFLLFVYRAWAAPALPAPAPGGAAPATLTATTVQPEGATVSAVTPGVISYQGTLTDASGKPLNGTINMTFRLYAAPTGGTAVWTEAHTGANAVPVSNGLFNVLLGSLTPIPSEVWSNATLYLGVQVGSDAEMTPREVVGVVPSSKIASAAYVLAAPDGDPANAVIVSDEGNVGIGTSNPTAKFQVQSFKAGTNSTAANGWLNAYSGYGAGWDGTNWRIATDSVNNGGALIASPPWSELRFYLFPSTGGGSDQLIADSDLNQYWAASLGSWGLMVKGNIEATGTKSAVVETARYGQRRLYAFEQATNRFGDEGKAKLVNGTAIVALDPVFVETIEPDFYIHLTPYGNASLYVAEIGPDYFVVKARADSDDVEFVWLLTGTRKGYRDVRLETGLAQMP